MAHRTSPDFTGLHRTSPDFTGPVGDKNLTGRHLWQNGPVWLQKLEKHRFWALSRFFSCRLSAEGLPTPKPCVPQLEQETGGFRCKKGETQKKTGDSGLRGFLCNSEVLAAEGFFFGRKTPKYNLPLQMCPRCHSPIFDCSQGRGALQHQCSLLASK